MNKVLKALGIVALIQAIILMTVLMVAGVRVYMAWSQLNEWMNPGIEQEYGDPVYPTPYPTPTELSR